MLQAGKDIAIDVPPPSGKKGLLRIIQLIHFTLVIVGASSNIRIFCPISFSRLTLFHVNTTEVVGVGIVALCVFLCA